MPHLQEFLDSNLGEWNQIRGWMGPELPRLDLLDLLEVSFIQNPIQKIPSFITLGVENTRSGIGKQCIG